MPGKHICNKIFRKGLREHRGCWALPPAPRAMDVCIVQDHKGCNSASIYTLCDIQGLYDNLQICRKDQKSQEQYIPEVDQKKSGALLMS